MPANSLVRRFFKRILHPILTERNYQLIQAMAMAWDIRTGSLSEPEIDLIAFAVQPGESVLDIGANYGLYCYHLSRAVGELGRVYAFEPVPFTNTTLRIIAKILQFKNVEIVPKGCSDRTEKMAFRVPIASSGTISAGQSHIAQRNDDRDGKETQVRWKETKEVWCETIALDEFLPPLKDLSLIKCDIEGAELFAFRGGQKIIEQHYPSVICEINPWYLEGFGIRLEELTQFFFMLGYSLYRYETVADQKWLRLTQVEEVVEDNYVFIHPSRRDRFVSLLQITN